MIQGLFRRLPGSLFRQIGNIGCVVLLGSPSGRSSLSSWVGVDSMITGTVVGDLEMAVARGSTR
jgi:hypothetical protein